MLLTLGHVSSTQPQLWLQKIYPGAEIVEIKDKGMINSLWKVGEDRVAKFSDVSQRISFEVEDLQLLGIAQVLTPKILEVGPFHIVMSFHLQRKVRWKVLTDELTKLHLFTGSRYGFGRSSYYGVEELENGWWDDWWDFFLSTRVTPLLKRLEGTMRSDLARMLRFVCGFTSQMGVPQKPALLHGDIWANNILDDYINLRFIDPVCYFGDPLVDFARFDNKHSSQIRCLFYRAFYQLHFDIFTNQLAQSEQRLMPVLNWIQREAFPVHLQSLLVGDSAHIPISPLPRHGLIYFACVNPPHPNHLIMLDRAAVELQSPWLEKKDGDRLSTLLPKFICPAPDSYLSKKCPDKYLSLDHRVRLLSEKQRHPILTFVSSHGTTLDLLQRAYPQVEWWVVVGSDALERSYQLIPARYGLICVPRQGYDEDHSLPAASPSPSARKVLFATEIDKEEWSSTRIRQDARLWNLFTS